MPVNTAWIAAAVCLGNNEKERATRAQERRDCFFRYFQWWLIESIDTKHTDPGASCVCVCGSIYASPGICKMQWYLILTSYINTYLIKMHKTQFYRKHSCIYTITKLYKLDSTDSCTLILILKVKLLTS